MTATQDLDGAAPDGKATAARNTLSGRSPQLALWVFVAILAAAVPIILFDLGSYRWFFSDEFYFITARNAGSLHDLFTPHAVHWSTVPVLEFRALYAAFGMRSYLPYQAVALAYHLAACVLLRVIMRRVGVQPWIATFAAASFVFFGPGADNITYAFGMSFTGALTFGLAQIVLGDHDGRIDKRDAIGLVFGLLALLSSSVGITMALITGMAMLGRRGWKVAAFHTAPLAAAFAVWVLAMQPNLEGPLGRPPLSALFPWVRSGETGIFVALGHYRVVAVLLGIVLVVGLVLAWSPLSRAELRRRASLPVAMWIGGIIFALSAASSRWYRGADYARAGRYMHILLALALPAIAVAMDAIARRWRVLTVPLILLLVVAVPANVDAFVPDLFGPPYMANRERILRNVIRMPEAREVPRSLLPLPDSFAAPTLTIGWLLDAQAAGKLSPSSTRMTPRLANEMRVILGVDQRARGSASECRTIQGGLDLSPEKGRVIGFTKPLTISTHDGRKTTSKAVPFFPVNGQSLTIRLAGLDLRIRPARPGGSFTLCKAVSPDEFLTRLLRLTVAQSAGGALEQCRRIRGSTAISPRKGAVVGFDGQIDVWTEKDGRRTSPRVAYDSRDGNRLTIASGGLHLGLGASTKTGSFRLCSVG